MTEADKSKNADDPDEEMQVDGEQEQINDAEQQIRNDGVQQGSKDAEDLITADSSGGWRVADDIYIPPPPVVFGEFDTTGPRLMLVKIVCINFKSYAGTVEIGPFHKSFSSIVGPNGNGKSNAIDAMLFVFGYKSSKIRTKKVCELIHNSSEFPNCNSCSVQIHFQKIVDKEGSSYDVKKDSAFVISKTAFKDNSAFYELNGKKVQLKVIANLLRSHYVDLDHNRFLILQGEVEQIALMKPKGQSEGDVGMLEFLEDIIGTTRFKEPLAKLYERVEELTELRDEKMRRLKVVEKARSELEEPMQEAVRYLRMENSVIKCQFNYYQCKRYEVSQQLAEEEEVKRNLDEEHEKITEEMKQIHTQKEEKSKDFKEKSKKWDKIQKQHDDLAAKFDTIRKKDEGLHAESVATNTRRKENIQKLNNEKAKLEDLKRIPEKNTKDIIECEKLIEKYSADLEKENAAMEKLTAGLKEKIDPLTKQRSSIEQELVPLKKLVDEAKDSYKMANTKLDLYRSEADKEKFKLTEMQDTLKTNAIRLAELKKQVASFDTKIPETDRNLVEAKRELHDLEEREKAANNILKNKRIKFDEQKNLMQASRSRNRCLDALMREKREGRIPGILGRLGDLGAIDAKFDVAISTACGPLDHIVVDTVNTAERCIQFLRANDIGRASFIPLEKQQRFAQVCKEKINTPENVHRLFDLIKVEDQSVLPAFYFAIQNTLVANNLEQATRIAYGQQRHRVVTLQGELIEKFGTMSGGGKSQSRGRMGQKVVRSEPSAKDIDALKADLEKAYNELNDICAKQRLVKQQIGVLEPSLNDMKEDIHKFKLEIKSLTEQESTLKKRLKEQENKVANTACDPTKIQQFEIEIATAKSNLKQVESNAKAKEDEVDAITHQIEEISGNRVKELKKKITNLQKSLEKTKSEVCRLEVAIKTSERNKKKTEDRIKSLEMDITDCQDKIRTSQEEKKKCELEAKEIMDQLEILNEQLRERDEHASLLKEELDKMQKQEGKIKSKKIDIDQKLHQKNKIVKELQQKIPDLTKALHNLKLQDIPNENNEGLVELTEEQLSELDLKSVAHNLQKAKESLPKDIPNMQIIEQYREQNEIYLKRSEKVQKITEERNKMREIYNSAIRKRMQEFNVGFTMITGKLKEMYRMITLGGDAELELVDSLDPFSEGIVFSVRPPKKSWKQIQNLSGGEKTLSSLALIFALHHYKPTPLYFMDEIDAALDFKNVSIVARYIQDRTKNAQFIVVSHRSDMFELADYLVGIYKIKSCSNCAVLAVKSFNSKVGIIEPPPPPPLNNIANKVSMTQPVRNEIHQNKSENRKELQPQRDIPATCPENIAVHSNAAINEVEQDLSAEMSFGLGDVSLPGTPQKTPLHPAKKRKIESNSSQKNRGSSRRQTQNKESPDTETNENSDAPLSRSLRSSQSRVRDTLQKASESLQSSSIAEQTPKSSQTSSSATKRTASRALITSAPPSEEVTPRRSTRKKAKACDEEITNTSISSPAPLSQKRRRK